MRRQQPGALGRMQLLRVVQQQPVPRLGEGVVAGGRGRVQRAERLVPPLRERVAHPDALSPQVLERRRVGIEGPRPDRWVAVDLGADGQGGRVSEDDVGVADPCRHQRQPGAEGEVVDDDVVRADPVDDGRHLLRDRAAGPTAGRRRGPPPGTPRSRRRRPGSPRRSPAAPRPRPSGWSSARITPGFDPRPSCSGSRSNPKPRTISSVAAPVATTTRSPACLPGGRQGGQRVEVRGVVRADHQQRHASTSVVDRRERRGHGLRC